MRSPLLRCVDASSSIFASWAPSVYAPLGATRREVLYRMTDDSTLVFPKVLTRLPIVGVLNQGTQSFERRLRDTNWQNVVLEHTPSLFPISREVTARWIGP